MDSKNLIISATHENDEEQNTKYSSLYANLDTTKGAIKLDHFDNENNIINNINIQFALVGANSTPYLSRFITNPFLIVESNSENAIQINNDLNSSVSSSSPVVINNLTAYQNNNLRLNLDSLDYGEDLGYDYITVNPRYLSGSLLKIETSHKTSIGAKLVAQDVSNVRYKSVTILNDNNRYETTTGKNGLIFLENIQPGTYSLFLNDNLIKVIDVPDNSGYIQLGDIKIE